MLAWLNVIVLPHRSRSRRDRIFHSVCLKLDQSPKLSDWSLTAVGVVTICRSRDIQWAEGICIQTAETHSQADHFRWAYPLAFVGAHIAFIPFFALLLPRKIEHFSAGDTLTDLSWVLLIGAVTASFAHILAGNWGDRWLARFGSRRGLIGIGLLALSGSYLCLAAATDVLTITAAVVAYQIALNLFFAPLGALLVDYVPDGRKGTVAGWLNAALPLASIFTAIIARVYPVDDVAGFWVVLAAVIACSAPLLILWPVHLRPLSASDRSKAPPPRQVRNDFFIAWCARFLIQFGAAIVLGYLFAYLSLSMDIPGFPVSASAGVATLALVAAAVGFASAVGAGRLSDGRFGRLAPMTTGAICVAIAFATLALTESWLLFVAAYAVCQIGLACFVTVDSALVAQLLHGHGRRGMWLGVMNLTNTLPGVFGPIVTLTVVSALSDRGTISVLFLLSAVAAVLASVIIRRIRSVR